MNTNSKLADDLIDGAAAAARFTGLKPRTIYRMAETGELPAIRKGGKIFFRKSDLEKAFTQQAEETAYLAETGERDFLKAKQWQRQVALADYKASKFHSGSIQQKQIVPRITGDCTKVLRGT